MWFRTLVGTDTVATYIEWTVQYMINYPEVQQKVHKELEEILGNRSATLNDRPLTPYTDATVQEIMRHSPHMHLTASRYTSQDCFIKGYFIPKNTQARKKLVLAMNCSLIYVFHHCTGVCISRCC